MCHLHLRPLRPVHMRVLGAMSSGARVRHIEMRNFLLRAICDAIDCMPHGGAAHYAIRFHRKRRSINVIRPANKFNCMFIYDRIEEHDLFKRNDA